MVAIRPKKRVNLEESIVPIKTILTQKMKLFFPQISPKTVCVSLFFVCFSCELFEFAQIYTVHMIWYKVSLARYKVLYNPQKTTLWLFNIAMENGPFIDGLPGFTY